jgi:hypothetical protein
LEFFKALLGLTAGFGLYGVLMAFSSRILWINGLFFSCEIAVVVQYLKV